MADAGVTHAGGVVVRRGGGESRYLIVRPSSGRDEWVLPKGHISADEAPERAALREVAEEAGVAAEIDGRLGESRFERGGKAARCIYYRMTYLGEVPREETREIAWCSYEEALERLSFGDTRQLLERARAAE